MIIKMNKNYWWLEEDGDWTYYIGIGSEIKPIINAMYRAYWNDRTVWLRPFYAEKPIIKRDRLYAIGINWQQNKDEFSLVGSQEAYELLMEAYRKGHKSIIPVD